ncbi:7819_t:CDS:2 [Paraglomus occultum]|uniref:7819_t:CDS:1 n=1 Tax=Paraglomus occultum TaxID=144539 RepID=A0A9N9CX37_9GLOM|nr:7819_t:CDS:2 [Paraglomus occultum]
MSSPSASPPSSTSSTLTEERSTCTMADVVKDLDTEEHINYLWKKDLKLKESHFKIFRKEEITGSAFLDMTEDRFRSIGLALGPAMALAKFIESLDQKLRSFSSYKTLEKLKDVLRKYKVNGEDITSIKQFNPVFEEIDDNDKSVEQCMNEILLRLTNVKSMIEANEATRCEFTSSILHASIAIARRLTDKEINIELQRDISAFGRVNYVITGMEDLLCITEGKPRNVMSKI